jgi:cob(I)alamin adenosyltransferase
MVKLNRLYTKNGDQGNTHLFGGELVRKNCTRIQSVGDVDELNSHLGLARTLLAELVSERGSSSAEIIDIQIMAEHIASIQNELFDLGAVLATATRPDGISLPEIAEHHVKRLESWIDELTCLTGELRSFVLPGGTRLNAVLHIARAVCRRTERTILSLRDEAEVSDFIVIYINRLSDYLFAAARRSAQLEQAEEFLWVPGAT